MSRYEDAEVTPDASFGADLGMNSFDFCSCFTLWK